MNRYTSLLLLISIFIFSPLLTLAQESGPLTEAALLKEKIELLEGADLTDSGPSARLFNQRALRRLYNQRLSSLAQEIISLLQREEEARSQQEGQQTKDAHGQNDAQIERLIRERNVVKEKLRALPEEMQEGVAPSAQAVGPTSLQPDAQAARMLGGPQSGRTQADPVTGKNYLPLSCREFNIKLKDLPHGAIMCQQARPDAKLDLAVLAHLSAPILWFSPGEPLKDKHPPEALPTDEKSDSKPVVYYRFSKIILKSGEDKSKVKEDWQEYIHSDDFKAYQKPPSLDLAELDGLTLRYYFYYSLDVGFVNHVHDLEQLRLDMHVQRRNSAGEIVSDDSKAAATDYYIVYIRNVLGAAHGISWYDNELDTADAPDISLPITALIEEGKHATCPDRDGDGYYNPGYDVNRRYEDAWGVRDIIGSGEVGGAKYEGYMTKHRELDTRIMVQSDYPDTILAPYRGVVGRLKEQTYLLRFVNPLEFNPEEMKLAVIARDDSDSDSEIVKEDKRTFIDRLERRENFRKDHPKVTYGYNMFQRAAIFGLGVRRGSEAVDAITFSFRHDDGQGFSIMPPFGRYQVPAIGGYIAPKINTSFFGKFKGIKRASFDGIYTPSASRLVDWYASAGPEWLRQARDKPFKANFAAEAGFRFRFKKTLSFLGGRLGVRTSGFGSVHDTRFIFELGTGAF